jgi:hypothetical protein
MLTDYKNRLMKPIDLFEQYINERMSDEVYHYTKAEDAVNILSTNKLYGTITIPDVEWQQPKSGPTAPYAISFTRTKYAGVGYPVIGMDASFGIVRFVIDGRAITNHGKTYQFDAGKGPEFEDRLWMNKPFIPYIRKHIKSIHVMVYDEYEYMHGKHFEQIYQLATKYNIPIFFYYDRKVFDLMNTRKAFIGYTNKHVGSGNNKNIISHDTYLAAQILVTISYKDPIGKDMVDKALPSMKPDSAVKETIEYMELINGEITEDPLDRYTLGQGVFNTMVYNNRYVAEFQAQAARLLISYMKKRGFNTVEDLLTHKEFIH